jgi:biopolymer transport protein TolR
MSHTGQSNRLMSDINVTPFVDVMLVLLIIFMVTAPLMMEGVKVDLPEASSAPISSDEEHLVVTVNKDGKIFISDYELTVDFLQEKLVKILDGRTDRELFLRADKTVPYGVVVRVMSEIKGAGIEKLGMLTEPLTATQSTQNSKKAGS